MATTLLEGFPYYDHITEELKNKGIWSKGKKFVREDRVRYDKAEGTFKVLPIKGYNTRTYTITPEKGNHLHCNCQWYNMLKDYGVESPQCSHKCAVLIWLQKKRIEKKLAREARIMRSNASIYDYSDFGPTPGVMFG